MRHRTVFLGGDEVQCRLCKKRWDVHEQPPECVPEGTTPKERVDRMLLDTSKHRIPDYGKTRT